MAARTASQMLALCLAASLFSGPLRAQSTLELRQQQAREEQQNLRAQIKALQNKIDAAQSSRDQLDRALQESESAISTLGRQLAELRARQEALEESRRRLSAALGQQEDSLRLQQQALAAQLRAQHSSGLSPWTALLSGRNPQEIGRELGWLAYIVRSRTQNLANIRATMANLQDLQKQLAESSQSLLRLEAQAQEQQKELGLRQQEQQQALEKIRAEIASSKRKTQDMGARETELGSLVQSLAQEIQRATARRIAAEKAAAEKAAAAKAAAQKAAAEKAAAAKAAAQQAAAEKPPAADTPAPSAAGGEPAPSAAPPADSSTAAPPQLAGLQKNLPRPVAGDVLGRFGAQRPEGGIWRGIVIRAASGAEVRSIADGRVVYASWLSGFGNLLIVDHGAEYLSIYAYNQTMLKEVGAPVRRGEVIAQVGATGGQVEPGLYFELRHQGTPINPQLWLAP